MTGPAEHPAPRPPRRRRLFFLRFALAFLVVLSFASKLRAEERSSGFPDDLDVALSYFVPEDAACRALFADVSDRIGRGGAEIALLAESDSAAAARVLRREILRNLKEKIDLASPGLGRFPLTPEEILRTVVGYEVFKMRAFLSSGVFPKRYFGYVDRKWDTAEEEETLLRHTRAVAQAINEDQRRRGRSVRVSDLEILVTYLAEGGALFFREERRLIEKGGARIDLGRHLGCDNIGLALNRYGDLARALDRRFGTRLAASARAEGRGTTGDLSVGITRRVDFRESILAMGLMYLYEKEVAAEKLDKRGKGRDGGGSGGGLPAHDLMAFPLHDQFVLASLVFNTGMLFPAGWSESIREFRTIDRLSSLSRENAAKKGREWRPPLPVGASPRAAFRDLAERGYPRQPTAWQGAYHVLQRYGAFVALREQTDLFDARGEWRGP